MQIFPPITLAIDYGIRRFGFAVSQASLAEPLRTVTLPGKNTTRQDSQTLLGDEAFDFVVREVKQLIEDYAVKQIVVGVSEGEMAAASGEFAARLASVVTLPVATFDETLSSVEVTRKLREVGRMRTGQPIDHFAAAEILERYMER